MGYIKRQINKIQSPTLRGLIKPVYLFLLENFKKAQKLFQRRKIRQTQKSQKLIEKKIIDSNTETIKVAFLVLNASIWKYDILFKQMLDHKNYEPTIFICPLKELSVSDQRKEINRIQNQFKVKNYPFLTPFDKKDELIDLKALFKPDIVFFTNPHELSYRIFSIENFLDTLTCYAPYSIMATNKPYLQYDKLFHNLLWRFYNETPIHHKMAKKYSRINGKNSRIAGSAIYEALSKRTNNVNVWKNKTGCKKIIYAPHHTFNDLESLNFSTIIENGSFMLEMAKKYKDKVYIAFKPHPVLKTKLYESHDWGKNKTDAFYDEWENLKNTQVEEGDYIDLFKQSDAIILDSISFITEYLFVNKPALFLFQDKKTINMFNQYGKSVLNCLEWSFNHESIETFIKNIIEENDTKKDERVKFVEENFTLNEIDFSSFIIEDIRQSLIVN
jgi:hypothetical protein